MYQYIQKEAKLDERERVYAVKLLECTKGGHGGTLFAKITEQFQQLCARIDGLILKHVSKEIITGLKEYANR